VRARTHTRPPKAKDQTSKKFLD